MRKHGCHDCAYAKKDDLHGDCCDLASWIVSVDEHGDCEQWAGRGDPGGAKGGRADPDGARRTDENLRRVFGG